jgi:membrane protease YdiL (CAAX protease family)
MTPATPSQTPQARIPFTLALVIILVMSVAYTVLDTLQPQEPILSILAFIPGVVNLVALFAAGLTRTDTNLRLARLSWQGAATLAVVTILLLPILGSTTSFVGWHWLPALVYAPASGIAQELFFRSSLLPALERVLPGRKTIALLLHSAIFIGFHYRTFQSIPSIGPALIVAVVLFAAGCGWGWQVQRDRTVVWAMVQHSLFLVLMSMFGWG